MLVFVSFLLLPNPNKKGLTKLYHKAILAYGFSYLVVLIFVTILDHETIRYLLVLLDPILAEEVKNRNYSIDCRLYTPENPESKFANIMGTMDVFVFAHLLGWFGKTIIYRNNILIWFFSIGFEILELSLKHYLPNFHECWWDHLILDVFGCNLIGIIVGHMFMKFFNIK